MTAKRGLFDIKQFIRVKYRGFKGESEKHKVVLSMKFTPIARSRVNPVARHFSRFMLALLGWKVHSGESPVNKVIVVAAPHTSNWDLLFTLLSAASINVPIWFMMKHTVFWWPLRIIWYYLGGVSIDRTAPNSVVSQMADTIKESERMHLVVTPEGTRKKVDYWKTGFYHIAQQAEIPLWPWYINYKTKSTGSGDLIYTTGDIEADFKRLRAFYEENDHPMPSCRPAPRKKKTAPQEDTNTQAS